MSEGDEVGNLSTLTGGIVSGRITRKIGESGSSRNPLSVGKGQIDYQATAKAGNAQSLIRYLPGMLLLQSDLGFRDGSILEENVLGLRRP